MDRCELLASFAVLAVACQHGIDAAIILNVAFNDAGPKLFVTPFFTQTDELVMQVKN